MTTKQMILVGIGALLLVVLLPFAVLELRARTAGFVGSRNAEVRLESASTRIARYDYFFNMCGSVQAYEDQIAVLQTQLDSTDKSDSKEINRLRSSISGLEGQRARTIRQYNADATKEYTAARFLASELPYQLTIQGETYCAI